jgi:hypothetical protein
MLVTAGYLAPHQLGPDVGLAMQVNGGIVTLGGIAWSIWQKRQQLDDQRLRSGANERFTNTCVKSHFS